MDDTFFAYVLFTQGDSGPNGPPGLPGQTGARVCYLLNYYYCSLQVLFFVLHTYHVSNVYKVSSSVILLQIMSKGEIILNQSTVTYSV